MEERKKNGRGRDRERERREEREFFFYRVMAVGGDRRELLQSEGTVILHITFALKQDQAIHIPGREEGGRKL